MKKALCYIVSLLAMTVIFGLCYYTSYQKSLKKFNKKGVERVQDETIDGLLGTSEQLDFLKELSTEEQEKHRSEQNAGQTVKNDTSMQEVPVAVSQKKTILPTVEYYEETYTLPEETLTVRQTIAPGFLIGMTREELETYVSRYMQNLPISEYEAGLCAYEIMSFSEAKVVLRKSYDTQKVPFKFYVNISDGMVTVYYSDLKTVYEYTHIPAVDLPEELRFSLIDGIYVKDREELYSLLESFSS